MSPRKRTVDAAKGVLEIEWPLFGELSRGLALKVARAYDPEVVIGIATAGVIPGAVIAAILGREFHSLVVSRKYHAEYLRESPEVFGTAPRDVRGRRVLIVMRPVTRAIRSDWQRRRCSMQERPTFAPRSHFEQGHSLPTFTR